MLYEQDHKVYEKRISGISQSTVNSTTSEEQSGSPSFLGKTIRAGVRKLSSSEDSFDIESKITSEASQLWKPEKKEWFIMLSLAAISLMVAVDATILVTVLPSMATSLNGTSTDAFWAGTSYLLASAVSQPVIASVSALFGRQQLLLFSLVFFTAGTIICCAANGFPVLLVGRSIQGVGGGGIITMTQVIFCDIVPLRQRPALFSIVLGSWSIGTLIGPIVGRALCQHLNWRWIFYINFPFCFLGFILVGLFVRLNAVVQLSLVEKFRKTDWVGAALFIGSTTSFLIGLSWGGTQHPWKSVATLAPIVVGLAGVGLFLMSQIRVSPNSLLPLSLFYCGSAFAAFYCALCNGLLLFTGLYYVPFYSMSVLGASPSQSGIDLFPALVFMLPGSIVVSTITTRIGRFRWAIWSGWVISTLGSGLFILLELHTTMAVRAAALVVFGTGSGMVLSSVNFGIQSIAKVEDSAMAASMYGFMRSIGMPLGVALSGTLFQNAMSSKLQSLGLPTSIARESESFVAKLQSLSPTDPLRIGALQAYSDGFRGVWIMMTAVSASALIASLFIKKFSMDKLLRSDFTTR